MALMKTYSIFKSRNIRGITNNEAYNENHGVNGLNILIECDHCGVNSKISARELNDEQSFVDRKCDFCKKLMVYSSCEYESFQMYMAAETNLKFNTNYKDLMELRSCEVQCVTNNHRTMIHFNVARFRTLYELRHNHEYRLACDECVTDPVLLQSNSGNLFENYSHTDVHEDPPSHELSNSNAMKHNNNLLQTSVEMVKDDSAISDSYHHSIPDDIVIHVDENNHETHNQFQNACNNNTVNKLDNNIVKEHHGDGDNNNIVIDVKKPQQPSESACNMIESGVIKKISTLRDNNNQSPHLSLSSSSLVKCDNNTLQSNIGQPFIVNDITTDFILPGALCKVHTIDINGIPESFLNDIIGRMENLDKVSARDIDALIKYSQFIVASVKKLHNVMMNIKNPQCNRSIIENCIQIMDQMKKVNFQCMKGSRKNNTILKIQNEICKHLLCPPDSSEAKTLSLNEHGSMDISSLLSRIILSRPHVIQHEDTTYSMSCDFGITEYVTNYMASDSNFDIMSDYINVKLKLVGTCEVKWCKLPMSIVHNILTSRTCYGYIYYAFMMKEMNKYHIRELHEGKTFKIVTDIVRGNSKESIEEYYDIFLRFTTPSDFFSINDMSNYIVSLNCIDQYEKNPDNILSWSRTLMLCNVQNPTEIIHPATYLVALITKCNNDNELMSLKNTLFIIKSNLSYTALELSDLININGDILRKICTVYDVNRILKIVKDRAVNLPVILEQNESNKEEQEGSVNRTKSVNNKRKKKDTITISPPPKKDKRRKLF
ncbi:hypothetical protein [Trichoplusia ni ascovirus 2c]|uniref:hypothetical protein n=1 Tax=Trichoplusia ni ascovirus 2c TaxID=328615 RepID=UPI0000E441DF|nr:hypothetical protein TNAV2c_gp007 [Trichoplusia ni ascovirus 2c]ABF70524.1 hypothetical protein [Trichoplusia ni ascovirus 2c]AUS94106.1 hypothetical protein [Trichoplusia ni ascovirus 6b]